MGPAAIEVSQLKSLEPIIGPMVPARDVVPNRIAFIILDLNLGLIAFEYIV
jgi:hypothetical protein